MSNRIILSPKYGVNASLITNVCPICGAKKEDSIALLGKLPDDKEAPRHMNIPKQCDECTDKLEKKQMGCLIVADEKLSKPSSGSIKLEDVYRTGEILWVNKEFFDRVFKSNGNDRRVCIVTSEVAKHLKKNFKERGGTVVQCENDSNPADTGTD